MSGASARYSSLRTPVETSTPPRRQGKLRSSPFPPPGCAFWRKLRSLRCPSSQTESLGIGADCISFASPQAGKLSHSVAPPLKKKASGFLFVKHVGLRKVRSTSFPPPGCAFWRKLRSLRCPSSQTESLGIGADCIPFASPQAGKLNHSVAPPLKKKAGGFLFVKHVGLRKVRFPLA